MPGHSQTAFSSAPDPRRTTSLCRVEPRRHTRLPYIDDTAEPSLAEMVRDPVFLQVMASDGVRMDSFLTLVTTVRQRLGR